MTRKELNICNELEDMDVSLIKAITVLGDLSDTYFSDANPEESLLKRYYADAEVRTSIIGDYLFEIKKVAKKITDILENEEDQTEMCK